MPVSVCFYFGPFGKRILRNCEIDSRFKFSTEVEFDSSKTRKWSQGMEWKPVNERDKRKGGACAKKREETKIESRKMEWR